MNIDTVLPLFSNVKKQGDGYTAHCPVCNDDHHLYITPKDGKVLFYCQKCNAGFEELRRVVSFPKDNTPPVVVEEYDHTYTNPNGSIAYYKTRTKYSDGKKKFTFYYVDQGKRIYKKPKICNTLYHLDMLESASASTPLYIVEGEKCADAMTKQGFLCTTTNTGAGAGKIKFSGTDLRLLEKFNNKILIPDNDTAGMKYADSFDGVKILKLSDIWPDIKPKQDVFDYIANGGNLDAIRSYVFEQVREYEELTKADLISPKLFDRLLAITDEFEHLQAVTRCTERARELKTTKDFTNNFRQYKISKAMKHQSQGRQTSFTGQPIMLNCGEWIADDFGVKKNEIVQSSGNVTLKFACTIPILPIEILYNDDEQIEKINIAFYKDGWKNVICERSTVANANRIIELSNKGVEVTSETSKYLVRYIADCVTKNLDVLPRVNAVSHLGWIGTDFIPYCDNVRFDAENEHKHLYTAVAPKGDYATWIAETAVLRQNIYMRMMLAASFASALIAPLDGLPFVLHLWGGTGSGKTVALMVALSVWGDPSLGKLVKTMNMTENAMLNTCGFLCNIPFAGDELQTIKSKYTDYDRIIMKVTEGIDRGRMAYDKFAKTKTWKNTIIFTGEEPCTKAYSGGGAKNRVIEIEVRDKIIQDGNATVNIVQEHHGHAGKAFIDIINSTEDLKQRFKEMFTSILSNCDTTEKQALSMAFILLADALVSEHIYHSEPLTHSDIAGFLTSQKQVSTSARAFDFVINLVARHNMRFASLDHNNGEIWGKEENEYVYINKDVLVSKMSEQGFEFDAVKKDWAQQGWLVTNSQGKFAHNTHCFGTKGIFIKLYTGEEEKPQGINVGTLKIFEDLPF